jgi:hypothetical protein
VLSSLAERVPDIAAHPGPDVLESIAEATAANFDYGLETARTFAQWQPDRPSAAIENARFAARGGLPLGALLHAYRIGHEVVWDMITEEIGRLALDTDARVQLLRAASARQFAYFNHLMKLVTDVHTSTLELATRSREQRRVEAVMQLLAGVTVTSAALGYEPSFEHLALVVRSGQSESAAHRIAAALGRDVLIVSRTDDTAWAWIGSAKPFDELDWRILSAQDFAPDAIVACGEPAAGTEGFRLSHRQAVDAYRVARRGGAGLTRYADVALVASLLADASATRSDVHFYLAPLGEPGSERSEALRATLRAYFDTGHNAASAAALLGIHERTVRQRLRAIEERLGYPIEARRAELDIALRVDQLESTPEPASPAM